MSATHGWRRRRAGSYDRGVYSIRNYPDDRYPDRPWVLYRATVDGRDQVARFHTLRLAQQCAERGGRL